MIDVIDSDIQKSNIRLFLKKDHLHSLLNMIVSSMINNCKVKYAMDYSERWQQFMTAKQEAKDSAISEFIGPILCPAWWW